MEGHSHYMFVSVLDSFLISVSLPAVLSVLKWWFINIVGDILRFTNLDFMTTEWALIGNNGTDTTLGAN